ncbi:MAG TPA: VWA domain-containing protein [Acidimicrobiales bacterium]|nr:VWA domain-containing protein [Acidimicrobiales bacterium]
MTCTWPLALFLLLGAPALLLVHVLSLRRRRKQAVTYSSVALLRAVLPRRRGWKRHVPAAFLALSIAALGVAAARPQRTRSVPTSHTSVILAMDVSRSMCATDVDPNRITVAQQAAKDFVQHQPAGTRTGLVVFAGSAQLAVPPTTDRSSILHAIDGLSTSSGTAIGAAMLKSLDAIAEVDPNVKPVGDVPDVPGVAPAGGASAPSKPPGAGGYVPDVVVLLTDGANNRGIAPLDAVPYAVDRRVRIYTIGFGTTQPAPLSCTVAQLGGDEQGGFFGGGFGGGFGGFGGFRSPLRADLPTLQQVSQRTGGASYTAENASQLSKVFASLPKDVTVQHERHEVTTTFIAIGALLAAAAVAASFRWSAYPS